MRGYGSRPSPWSRSQMRETVRAVVLADGYDQSDVDDIRLDAYFKLTGKRSWPDYADAPNAQILSILNQMADAGELVKTGGLSGTGGWRSRSPVHFRTPAAQAAIEAEREARREAQREAEVAWREVRTALEVKLSQDVKADKHGKPDLDLDTWQEVIRLMT